MFWWELNIHAAGTMIKSGFILPQYFKNIILHLLRFVLASSCFEVPSQRIIVRDIEVRRSL